MTISAVQFLLGTVRRRMWRGEFVAAARLALWGTAGLMLLAVAVHLAVRPVRVGVLLSAITVLWASMVAWALLRRPSDSACALWADRHLGGASAFSTLLDIRNGTQAAPSPEGLSWLEHWATARVPHSMRLLEERRDPARLSRALVSMLVCATFAALVLTLPELAPSSRQELTASTAPSVVDRPVSVAEPPVTAELVSELARALRSAESRRSSDRREVGRAPAEGSGKSNDTTASGAGQPGSATPDQGATGGKSLAGTPVDAAKMTAATRTSGAGSGRDAGDSPDDRADARTSRVPQSKMPIERRESSTPHPPPERQADMDRLATFDEDLSTSRGATEREPAAAAATPPPAVAATRLTPTKAAYVQAWIKASGQRR
jgi:hypothetical protein